MPEERPAPSFDWMKADVDRVRAVPGEHGLTLGAIMIGRAADVPDHWPFLDDTPRGAAGGGPVTFASSYSINDKADVWSENAADLYEQAIRERWTSAADVPWGALELLPLHRERAMGQICTRLSEEGFATQQVLGKWLERIAYGFLEVKSFLATQIFDAGRQCELFRKRAIANGGGLGIESPGIWNRALTDALKLTELIVAINILRSACTIELLGELQGVATNDADRTICSLVARDHRRHVEFGIGHLAFHVQRRPERRDQLNLGFLRAESAYANDLARDRPFMEALVIALGADDGEAAGWERLLELNRRQAEAYLLALDQAGLPEHRSMMYAPVRRPYGALVGR